MRPYILLMMLAGCAVSAPDAVRQQDDAATCTRVEGEDLGSSLTVHVRALDAVRAVTFMTWQPKRDGAGYVGFTLDATATFVVKADFNFFYEVADRWENPFGTSGSLAFPIDYVDLCDAFVDDATSATP